MEVTVTLYSSLASRLGSSLTVPLADQGTVEELVRELGLALHDVEVVAVNGSLAGFATALKHGDRVSLLPFMSGG